jgi:hypothetical protein
VWPHLWAVAGSPGSGIVELALPRDEAAGFQLLERSHDVLWPASDSAISGADRRVAGEVLIGLVGEQEQDELGGR